MAINTDLFFPILFKVSLLESFLDRPRKNLGSEKLSANPFSFLFLS